MVPTTSYVVTESGIFLSARSLTVSTQQILFYSNKSNSWSNITGNLPTSSTAVISSNGNGLVYVNRNPVLYVYSAESTWTAIPLPSQFNLLAGVFVEGQTRKLVLLGRYGSGTVAAPYNHQFFQLESNYTLTPLGGTESAPTGFSSAGYAISGDGTKHFLRYIFGNLYQKYSINGSALSESIPSRNYTSSNINNDGYVYSYPITESANNRSIYQCTSAGCNAISSTNQILNTTTANYITSLTSLSGNGIFALTIRNYGQESINDSRYICDNNSCTQQGNEISSESGVTFITNPYTTSPTINQYGFLGGFYWLTNNIWNNLAPSLNDGNESSSTIYDRVLPACGYTASTPLIRYIGNSYGANTIEQLYVNNSSGTWQNISESITSQANSMVYSVMYPALNPANGASTFGGIIGLETGFNPALGTNNTLINMYIYPQNIVCPALY